MTEAEFSDLSLKILLTGLVGYMLFIVYRMGKDSNAGRYGMIIMFIALGAGFFSFAMKGVLKYFFAQ